MSSGDFELPFVKGPLRLFEHSGGRTTLIELLNNSELLLRDQLPLAASREKRVQELSVWADKAGRIAALRERGVYVPEILLVEGEAQNWSGEPRLYIFVDKIFDEQGRIAPNLSEIFKLPRIAVAEADNLLTGLLDAAIRAFRSNQPVFRDIKIENFSWGRKGGEFRDHFWLIDVDPQWARRLDGSTDLLACISDVEEVMYHCEKLLGMKLMGVREKVREAREVARDAWYE